MSVTHVFKTAVVTQLVQKQTTYSRKKKHYPSPIPTVAPRYISKYVLCFLTMDYIFIQNFFVFLVC